MTPDQSRRAHDIADVCERMIDLQLERLAWLGDATRAMGHSPDGQDAKRLEAKPEWPGLAAGEMRPNMTRQTRKEGDK